MARLARLLAPLALCAMALVAAGCGSSRSDIRTLGDSEGIYVDVGPLTYQVQISRYLNPADVEDSAYLKGVPPTERALTGNQVWFGVFMRVQNYTERTHVTASNFAISDTQHNVYRPVFIDTSRNVFAYHPRALGGSAILPDPGSLAAQGPIGGSLLLYKLNVDSIQNRPLEMTISQAGKKAVIDLDV
jgi:hypothetical protein